MCLRRSFWPLAAVVLTLGLLGAAIACAPAVADDQPLAEVTGMAPGPLLDKIRATIGTAPAPPQTLFDARRRASRARDRALAVLRSEGYYGARVDPQVERGEPPSAAVAIDTGQRFEIGLVTVVVSGETDSPAADAAREASRLRPGMSARAQEVLDAEARAVAAVGELGYPDVAALERKITVDHARKAMDVELRLDSGRAAVMGPIRIAGPARLRQRYVSRLAPYKPGGVYDREALDTLAKRLRETGALETVTVRLAPSTGPGEGPEERPVVVEADAGKRRTITLGASYSTSEGEGVEGSWSRRNVLGGAETFTASLALKDIEQRVGVELSAPHWRRPGRTLRLNAALSAEQTDAYDREALEIGARAGTQLTETERVSGVLGTGLTLSSVDDGTMRQRYALLYATASIAWDGSDDLLDPKRGARASASAKPTVGVGESPLAYVVAETAASAYYTPIRRVTFAARGRVGAIMGPPIDQLPADERFFAGGGGSVRGYEFQSVSPRNAAGVLVGGRSLIETSLEARLRTNGRIGYVAFVDGGAATDNLTPEPSAMRWGAGVGARYFTRFGPIRADIAVPLDRRSGEPSVQLYFAIGQAF